jgi:hypothetical protein
MYQIKCINGASECHVYDPRVPSFAVIKPQMILELNKSGILSFGMPDGHPNR